MQPRNISHFGCLVHFPCDLAERSRTTTLCLQPSAAARLGELSAAMEGYRDLPMGGHDMDVLMDRTSRDVFAAFIQAEEEALALLQTQVREYRAMFDAMSGSR